MKAFEIFKLKKIFFFQVFLTLYVGINLIGGERGLISYFEKDVYEKKLSIKNSEMKIELEILEHKNKLLSESIDLDYLDTLYRTKLKFGTKDEILIKLKQ
jgi:cell division protein FtsB